MWEADIFLVVDKASSAESVRRLFGLSSSSAPGGKVFSLLFPRLPFCPLFAGAAKVTSAAAGESRGEKRAPDRESAKLPSKHLDFLLASSLPLPLPLPLSLSLLAAS